MAAPTATVNGLAVNFGFAGTNGITISPVTGTLLQNVEHTGQADLEITRDGNGAEVAHGWHNDHDEATLEWVISGTGLAAAITNTALIRPGSFVSITACTSMPGLVGTWEAQMAVKISGSNVTSKRFSLPIKKFGGITGTATA